MEDNSPEGLKRETTAGLLSLLDYVKTKVRAADLAAALEQLVRDYTAHPNSDAVGISTLHDTMASVKSLVQKLSESVPKGTLHAKNVHLEHAKADCSGKHPYK